ncbi:MAG: peptidoglycan DD-metalloendopeptidase family protein [Chitinophagales bacterium]|nr:peptidoglycan DD-metalloendopeptidase family protein [Chitinophagales bacterium]MDW8420063.1 peptidoglycan DD-metalloendopeptidase family protein [Chitinophagales bacterium]
MCIPLEVGAQTAKQKKEQLQQQMEKIQQEIKMMQEALRKNERTKEKSLSEIQTLQAKIRAREKLINNIQDQINELDVTIDSTRHEIEQRSQDLEKMKSDYAAMLRKSYGNLSLQNELAFILSAETFYDALRRYNYLNKAAEYRREQALRLRQYITALESKKDTLESTRQQKENLLAKQTEQKRVLETEKKEKDQAVAALQEKEKKLRRQIDEKNKLAQQLNQRIQAIIEDEIRQAKKKLEQSGKAGADKKESMPLTPEEQALSKDFLQNKGKLPWPVAKGVIISSFGRQEHPALKGVMIENNGLDIRSEAGAEARAVFEGEVVSVFYLPGMHHCVILKHGEYFTVYSGIETVHVKPAQKVNVKQSLGKLYTDKSDNNFTKIHIEFWKGKEKLDPQLWLAG